MTQITAPIKPPKIPSKYDIIPIHASDRGAFRRCKRFWDWSSPMRRNLTPNVEMIPPNKNLWYGSGIHFALAQYYSPTLKRDPVEAFLWWFDLQMHGGIVRAEEVDLTYDRNPKAIPAKVDEENPIATYYKVRGLYDLLPDSDYEIYEEHRELGIGMLTFYKEYAEREDNFAVICEEHTFSVPILEPSGEKLFAIDPRDGQAKEVHIRGTQDAIIQDLETGQFGILEHKSAISIDENYHRKLEKDEQCTTYMFSAESEARIHDLEYERISFVLYNALRKAYPKPPTPIKSGLFSINRQTESTTIGMLRDYIRQNGLELVVDADEKLKNYVEYVEKQGDKQFIERTHVRRNRAEIESCGLRIYLEAMDMLTDPRIYPNPTGDWLCLNCAFRVPCIAADDGSDSEMILLDNFVKNWTR
jgi:hypothetical protein